MSDACARVFDIVVGHEGDRLDTNRDDKGNWTSGIVGVGQLRGSKFGVSAAAYPDLLIADLTKADALAIFERDYWRRVHGDDLPPALGLLVTDSAYNNGVSHSGMFLQQTVGVPVDGAIGPQTLAGVAAAVARIGEAAVCAEFQARRMDFMAGLTTWQKFGLGWSRRLITLIFEANALSAPTA